MTGQSHFMLIFVLRKVTLCDHTNSVHWMCAIGPKILWFNWMKMTLRSRQTANIHSMELVWPRTFIVRSRCNHLEWLYGAGLCLLYCTVLYDHINWLYGVKQISIKWLWPVKVTLKVIKRRLKVFCWSCDGVPLKWNKKNCHYRSNDPYLASQFEWSVNTFN